MKEKFDPSQAQDKKTRQEFELLTEEEKQAEARSKAADKRLEVVDKFIVRKLSPLDAAHEADKLMDPTITKNLVGIQGDVGVFGGLIAGALGKGGGK